MLFAVAVCERRAAMFASQPPDGVDAPASRPASMTAPASAVASAPFWVTRCWASTLPPSTIVPTIASAATIATTMTTIAWPVGGRRASRRRGRGSREHPLDRHLRGLAHRERADDPVEERRRHRVVVRDGDPGDAADVERR